MNKKIIIAIIFVVLLVGVVVFVKRNKFPTPPTLPPAVVGQPTLPTSQVDISDWQVYRNEEYGFEIKYPKGWDYSSDESRDINSNFNGFYIANFDIKKLTERDFTKDPFFSFPKEDSTFIWIYADKINTKYGSIRENFEKAINEKYLFFGGVKWAKETFTTNSPSDRGPVSRGDTWISVGTIKDNVLYKISIKPFDTQYVDLFEQILSTFRFLD